MYRFLYLALLLAMISCRGLEYNVEKIQTGFGPEDMALDFYNEGRPRIIISCSKRKGENTYGKLQYYDLNSGNVVDFVLSNYNTTEIRPHGITRVSTDSTSYLYVISHEKNEGSAIIDKILKFTITPDTLFFVKQWTSEEIDFMDATNDLVVNEKGIIYCTNPTQVGFKEVPAVVGMISQDGKAEVIADGLLYPNGIYLDGNKLYVATAQGNILYKYELDANGKVKEGSRTEEAEIVGGDNITKNGDYLIIANHPSLLRFVLHSRFGTKSPSSVYRYNTLTGESKQIFGPTAKYISASSTGLIYKDYLYISQVFEDYIIKVQFSDLEL